MTINNVFIKSPSAVLDFKFDWAARTNGTLTEEDIYDWLQTGETIVSYNIIAGSGITVTTSSLSDSNTSVTAWLAGGLSYHDYDVTCLITTSGSPYRTDERTIKIQVRDR